MKEYVDLLLCIVDPHTQPCGRLYPESPVQWLRAVMPRAQADPLMSENFGEVVGVNAVDGEAEATGIARVGVGV